METARSSALRVLCLVEACWRGSWRSSREGCSRRERVNDRRWHCPILAVPYNYVFWNHRLTLHQNTFSLGVHDVFLFPNVLNPRRGYLVRRRLSGRAAYPGDLSKVTKLLGSSWNQWLGVCSGFYQLAWELAFCLLLTVSPWYWWRVTPLPVPLRPSWLFCMLSTVCLLLPTRFVGPPRPSAKPFPSVDGSKRLLTCAGSHGQVVEGSQARTLIVTVTAPR